MNKNMIYSDESQVKDFIRVPVIKTGYWTFTLEASALHGKLDKAVRSVFATFPKVVQQALTFTSESGDWANRARFWNTVLRLALPPKQYHQAMQMLLHSYRRAVHVQSQRPQRQEREINLEEEAGPFFLMCYQMGAAGENRPLESDFETEARMMSLRTNIPMEHVMENHVLRLLFQLGNDVYEQGEKLRLTLQERRLPG